MTTTNQKFLIIKVLTFFIFLAAATAFTQLVSAEPGLGVFPPVIKARVVPRAVVRQPIRVFNNTQREILIGVDFRVFEFGSLIGQPLWSQTSNLPDWIRINAPIDKSRSAFVIKPSGYLDFVLTIAPPARTAYQDKYFTIIFYEKPQGVTDKVSLTYQIGVNVLLTIDGSLEVKVKPVRISHLKLPLLANSWARSIPIEMRLYNPNDVWVEAVPFVKLEKVVGIGKDESLNLVPISLLSRNERQVFVTEEMVELALTDNRVQSNNNKPKSPLERVKIAFFSKDNTRSANNLKFSSDSFKLGVYRWQIEVLTEKQKTSTSRLVVFIPIWLILLIGPGLWVWMKIKLKK